MPGQYDYQIENPSRMITIRQSDGNRDIVPKNLEGWKRYEINEPVSKRWRGVVGTLIAALSGWDTSGGRSWHLSDWPEGFSLWGKVRTGTTRSDYYLYGRSFGPPQWSSPIEFVLHGFFLFSNDEHSREGGCRCNQCTGRKQGIVNEVEFGMPRRATNANRQPAAPADPMRSYHGGHDALRSQQADRASGTSAGMDELLTRIHDKILEQARAPRSADKDEDVKHGQKFRVGELVWISILPITSHSFNRPLPSIEFWPGYVRKHQMILGAPADAAEVHHTRRNVPRTDEYEVTLLGIGVAQMFREEVLLPWQAFIYPEDLNNRLDNPVLQAPVTRGLRELSRFPVTLPLPPNSHSRDLENALAPLTVGMTIAHQVCSYHFPTDDWAYKFTAPDGSSETRWQGCWLGPERIWAGDYVRVAVPRTDFQDQPWYSELRPPSLGALNLGLLLKVRHIATDHEDKLFITGPLVEICPASHPEGYIDESVRKPLPPRNYKFRRITPEGVSAHLPWNYLAGKYEYWALESPLVSPFFELPGPRTRLEDMNLPSLRLIALGALGPSHPNKIEAMNMWTEASRDLLMEKADREAKRKWYLYWKRKNRSADGHMVDAGV